MADNQAAAKTSLYQEHVNCGGKMVDFAGWLMPVNYGSQIEEHTAVRSDAGMFDVSHMTIIDVQGAQAEAFLRRLVANDVAKLCVNQALTAHCLMSKRAYWMILLFIVWARVVGVWLMRRPALRCWRGCNNMRCQTQVSSINPRS